MTSLSPTSVPIAYVPPPEGDTTGNGIPAPATAWDYEAIAIEDDEPVDSLISEKQQRLAVNAAYSSYAPGVPFLAAANVGLFYDPDRPPLVPDVLVSLNVEVPEDWSEKKNRSYFVAVLGKLPELAVEIVSNKKGNELGSKQRDYAKAGILYYAVFDPLRLLSRDVLRVFELHQGRYRRLSEPWFEPLGVGLTLWEGVFEGRRDRWLRWCDCAGQVLLTGDELAERERDRAALAEAREQAERDRAAQAEIRAQTERDRAAQAEAREQTERDRAEAAERRAAELAERLRALETGESDLGV